MTKYSFETFEKNKSLIHYYIFITNLPPSYFVSYPHSLLSLSLSLSLYTHSAGSKRLRESARACGEVHASGRECSRVHADASR
jgi:hypothetical protein